MSQVREKSTAFVDASIATLAKERIVLDLGGGERFGKWMKRYEGLFAACDYRTFDFDASTGADVVGDIHAIPLADASVDAIICSSVLEHVNDPVRAFAELERILKPGGKVFFYVPSIYPYHARPGHYPDCWRFFEDSVRGLFKDFTKVELKKRGGYFLALSFFFPMQHKLRFLLTPLADALDGVLGTEKKSTTAGYFVYAVK